ncbi:hypothetical protein BgiBS90_000002, partial [Biomphalaria glabrata]
MLTITNTLFQLPHRKKTSWMHPRSKNWHQIDFIIVIQSDRQDVKVTKALCGADCWTDHRLILPKLKICIKPPRRLQESKHAKQLNVVKAFYSHQQNGSSPIFSADGNKLLTDKEDILVRWAEHFCTVLNCPSSISAEAIARKVTINHSLADPPRLNEVMFTTTSQL